MNHHDTQVLITGGGPAGLALAASLGQAGIACTVLEQQPLTAIEQPADDGREIALTHRARRILEQLGMWQRLPADAISPLREARVSDGDSPLVLPFDARREGHEALGWLVPNRRLREAAYGAARDCPQVRIEAGTRVTCIERDASGATLRLADAAARRAQLVVAADSRFSALRRAAGIGARSLDFGRTAIVGRLAHTMDHGGIAHECFRYGNTLATLPLPGRMSSAVVTVPAHEASEWLALDDASFAGRVERQLGGRLGAMQAEGLRHGYPLVAVYASRFAGPRIALIGDAAVGMHPVTAHGYNFGLYGVEVLSREIARAGNHPASPAALAAYERQHRLATLPIYLGTNAIVRLYTDESRGARLLRGTVLRVARSLPPLRTLIAQQLTGTAAAQA